MKTSETVRKVLRISFYLLQIIVVSASAISLLLSLTIFLRSNSLIALPIRYMIPIIAVCILSMANGYLGITSINTERKTRIFIFILTLVIVMNFQVIFAMAANKVVDQKERWMNDRWESFSIAQKKYVEKSFQCCGLETIRDRSNINCRFDRTCSFVFTLMARTLQKLLQKSLLCLFFIESLSLTILSFVKSTE